MFLPNRDFMAYGMKCMFWWVTETTEMIHVGTFVAHLGHRAVVPSLWWKDTPRVAFERGAIADLHRRFCQKFLSKVFWPNGAILKGSKKIWWTICNSDLSKEAVFENFNFESKDSTLPETNIAPENGWLEDEFPFGKSYFQGRTVSFREGISTGRCGLNFFKICQVLKVAQLQVLGVLANDQDPNVLKDVCKGFVWGP